MKEIWSGDELNESMLREWKETPQDKGGAKNNARTRTVDTRQGRNMGKSDAGRRRGVLPPEAQTLRLGNAMFRRR